jgi:hypothetical protein
LRFNGRYSQKAKCRFEAGWLTAKVQYPMVGNLSINGPNRFSRKPGGYGIVDLMIFKPVDNPTLPFGKDPNFAICLVLRKGSAKSEVGIVLSSEFHYQTNIAGATQISGTS